ncbi:hypothetical protein GQ44DRAFT_670901 [Phaeosphaeriaceae sp. PMI808]|nr:hypothetical protein GQ44DRAFT_670901 [Phaeosphaeriaceae sp. PMI808]
MASSISFGPTNFGFQAGIINGPVSTEFHLPPERLETPPVPLVVIPFSRDRDFIEPGTILKQIDQKCVVPGLRTALVGLGGVGKSQLAIEYAYRTGERSPSTWVFWAHASNAARLEQSFRDIANYIKLPGRQNPKANIFQLLHDWLCDKRRNWVLILDNVDDAGFLLEAQSGGGGSKGDSRGKGRKGLDREDSRPLVSYLPQCQNGSILITTRVRNAALKLVEQHDIITVEPMSEADAQTLLEKKLGKQDDNDRIAELATALEFMPLAIVQAAAYISQRAPRYSVQEYLEEFRRSDRERATLLDFEGGQLRRDWEAKNSIIITWQISFDHIRRIRPSASNLLSLMSFFDRQGIPEALVRNRAMGTEFCEAPKSRHSRGIKYLKLIFHRNKNRHKGQIQDPECRDLVDSFEDDVLILRNFSFISIDKDRTTFEMHRLVQLAIKRWLEAHGQRERWKHQFIVNLSSEFPTGKYENWAICQALFPHAKSAAVQKPENQESLKMWATILYKAAWYAEQVGNGAEAEEMSVAAMEARKKLLGWEHKDTLWSMSLVGNAYNLRGQWSAAESLFVQVMETRKSKLGVDHPDTLNSMANLALTYRNQGRWEEAESLFVQVIETSKSKLRVDHPNTMNSMANLASTYRNQGRWEEAESLEVQVMETRKSKLGVDHPDTLTSIANLAATFWNQGRWEEAESLEVQVIETRKSKLGVDHPDTLTSMANLAATYRNQGRWEEAESLEVQVMETRKSKLGVDHPGTLNSMANLAATFWNQGRWEEAESLFVQVIETRKSKLGVDHPDTLNSMANLAATFWNQGRWEEAESLFVQAIETSKSKLGVDHPDTLTSMVNLAATYRNQERWEEAESLEVQVMETRKSKLGVDHPDTLISMNNLAFTFKGIGSKGKAIRLMEECVRKQKYILGPHHPYTKNSENTLNSWRIEGLAVGSPSEELS